MKNVFEFNEYKSYLLHRLSSSEAKHGIKTRVAEHAGIQTTYLSSVLNGNADLNLEQADRVSSFFLHSEIESHFFLLLLQRDRSGTKSLKNYFDKQIQEIKKNRLVLIERLGALETKISEADQQKYYSSWIYSALHIAVTIPELQNKQSLKKFLNIDTKTFLEALHFLNQIKLIQVIGEQVKPGQTLMRLGQQSHNIIKHHTNWRIQAIQSLDHETASDLHYSGVFSLSKKDIISIKNKLLDSIKEVVETVKKSPEEELYNFNMDFYELKKNFND